MPVPCRSGAWTDRLETCGRWAGAPYYFPKKWKNLIQDENSTYGEESRDFGRRAFQELQTQYILLVRVSHFFLRCFPDII